MIFSLLVLAVLVSLGNWQVRRLTEKRAYLNEIAATLNAAPVAVPRHPTRSRIASCGSGRR